MAPNHIHAPWRKGILLPFWILQLLFEILIIGLLAFALSVLVIGHKNVETIDNLVYSNVDSGTVGEAEHV
jgi:hypothetical protein